MPCIRAKGESGHSRPNSSLCCSLNISEFVNISLLLLQGSVTSQSSTTPPSTTVILMLTKYWAHWKSIKTFIDWNTHSINMHSYRAFVVKEWQSRKRKLADLKKKSNSDIIVSRMHTIKHSIYIYWNKSYLVSKQDTEKYIFRKAQKALLCNPWKEMVFGSYWHLQAGSLNL